uniref:Protein phosphatase 1 regulatory subunit n=1 Tax=Nothobranchius furzeri TaxID=105023 RepID=A0A8C6P2V7_NOTFU
MADAKQKRNEQLKQWLGSETDQEPSVLKKKKTKVKFDDGAVFLAACSSGDTEEVLRLLDRGADINYANVDGLTALHQACIDDNVDMVTFLVEHGANLNQPDNEGWIPLHAAASCGYLDIAEYLISQGANVGVVNSEGETPLDIAEEGAMEELLQNEINRQGLDIEAARKEEERIMLRDARQWLNSGQIQDVRHIKSGGTALHVAAAKGYVEVLKLLIQAGYDVNIKDNDGWTPLHAAAHWGKEEACKILVENQCDMDIINKMGQTAFDVADEDVLGYLEELQKKQNLLTIEKKDVKKSPLIETTTMGDNNQSLKPLKSKETLLLEPEKTALRIETLEPEKVDEEEEGKKDESSCSSEEEEEEDSESETEAEKSKPAPAVSSSSTPTPTTVSVTVSSPTSPTNQVTTPTSPVKKFDYITPLMPLAEPGCPSLWRQGLRKTGISLVPQPAGKVSTKVEEEKKDESPASWRLGLRKTGSYGALSEITATKDTQREKETTGVMRSASSPRLTISLDNKEKEKERDKGTRLAYVAPTIPRRLASFGSEEESLVSPSRVCSDIYSPPCSFVRLQLHRYGRSNKTVFLVQGVTLTDLQEAEKTIGRSRPLKTREEEKEEKEKQDKEKQEEKTETKEDDYQSKYRSFEELLVVPLPVIKCSPSPPPALSTLVFLLHLGHFHSQHCLHYFLLEHPAVLQLQFPQQAQQPDGDHFLLQPLLQRHRKRSLESEFTIITEYFVQVHEAMFSTLRCLSLPQLYEQIFAENEKLKAQLRDTDLELADLKLQLEKAAQRQERYADRSQLEMEKRERRALERKISEMEEELKNLPQVKQVQALRQMKERLQAENRALARVVAKLSQLACSQLPSVDL